MAGAVDLYMVYQFVKKLSTPFTEWDAYKTGVIDKNGKILKSSRERRTREERSSLSKFDLLVLKIKKLVESTPGNSNKLSTYAAALWFIKENLEDGNETLTEESFEYYLSLTEKAEINRGFEELLEEPTMSAGGGQIDGIGIGNKGEPGFTKAAMNRYKKKNEGQAKQMKRFVDMWTEK